MYSFFIISKSYAQLWKADSNGIIQSNCYCRHISQGGCPFGDMIPAGTYPIRLQIKQGGSYDSPTHYASISGFSIHTTRHLQQCDGACFEDINPDEYYNWLGEGYCDRDFESVNAGDCRYENDDSGYDCTGDGFNTEECNWDGGDCCINNPNGMDCLP